MDALSDALVVMRSGRPHSARRDLGEPWRLGFPTTPAAGFHVVLEGRGWVRVATGAAIPLSAGDVVLVPHGDRHELFSSPDAPLVELSFDELDGRDRPTETRAGPGPADARLLCGGYLFDRSRMHPLLAELPEVIHLPASLIRHSSLRILIETLAQELAEPQPGRDVALASLLEVLLLFLLRSWYADRGSRSLHGRWGAALSDPVVAAGLDAIHAQPAQPWTVATLAAHSGMSRASFASRFTDLVGHPPLGYLTWWRMTLAAKYLRDEDAALAVIARRVGYTSEFAFSRAFKRDFGLSPGGYRRHRLPSPVR